MAAHRSRFSRYELAKINGETASFAWSRIRQISINREKGKNIEILRNISLHHLILHHDL